MGPHPHDLYLATFGRSAMVATSLFCLVLRSFYFYPVAFNYRVGQQLVGDFGSERAGLIGRGNYFPA